MSPASLVESYLTSLKAPAVPVPQGPRAPLLKVAPRTVTLPAHAFSAHPLQRLTLTGRPLARVRPGAMVAARLSWASKAPRPALLPAPGYWDRPVRPSPWGSLSSFALILAIVVVAFLAVRWHGL